MEYKQFVPVCGAILLNWDLDKVRLVSIRATRKHSPPSSQAVLVKGWKGSAGWGFPKGKINQTESLRQCAIREVECFTTALLSSSIDRA
jgi:mRNA-decapping enzyme subunit 2